ncbi:MAG: DUF3298 and DUF4163 domain-containing protein [Mediterranea sp.]|jgi:hypothetical protein|nr:DUF3298 and DUF4163 domain-containing protein [Mediterranea sp.]
MKNQFASLLAIILPACGIYTSCTGKAGKTGGFEFEHVQINKTAHLFGDTTKPGTNIIIDFTYISKSSDDKLKDSLNACILSACFGDKYAEEDISEIPELYAQNYIGEYRQDLEPMFVEDQKNKENAGSIASWYSYYKGLESQVTFYEKDLLVYRIDFNEYTGGAHGMYTSTFLNFDLKNMRQLVPDDIFTGDYRNVLTDLLWNQLMANQKVQTRTELENMGYGSTGDLVPTENFYMSKEGITFYYNVYEFTPYVMGAVEIALPYAAIEQLMNPAIKRLTIYD